MGHTDDDQAEDQSGIRCIICRDPRLEEIDKLLQVPRKERAVSREFGFSRATIHRHKSHMVSELQGNPTSLTQIEELERECRAVLKKTKVEKVKLDAIGRLASLQLDRARLSQESGVVVALTSHPSWDAFIRRLESVLCMSCIEALKQAPPGGTR